MPINPLQLIQMLRTSGGNPQQMVMNMLQEQAGNNPVLQNLLDLAQQGKTAEIEKIARNIVSERGLDFNTEFNSFKKNNLGL